MDISLILKFRHVLYRPKNSKGEQNPTSGLTGCGHTKTQASYGTGKEKSVHSPSRRRRDHWHAITSAVAYNHWTGWITTAGTSGSLSLELVAHFTGIHSVARLIEFKAEGADLRKERGKHAGLKKIIEDEGLYEISRDVHWYVETKATTNTLGLLTIPYLDAFPRDRKPSTDRLEDLVQSTAEAIATQRASFTGAQIRRYLLAIKTVSGKTTSGSGGLLLLAEPGGVLKFAPLEDILELNMAHREWVNARIAHTERSHKLMLQKMQEKELKNQKSFEPGMR